MNDQISAFMDGELTDEEARSLLTKLKESKESQQQWGTYHLIGDAIRQTTVLSMDLSRTISAQLDKEPTVLAPHKITPHKREMIAWSAAASFAAVAVVALAALKFSGGSAGDVVLDNLAAQSSQPSNTLSASKTNPDMNAYLVAHQEFSPSATLSINANYARVTFTKQQDMAR